MRFTLGKKLNSLTSILLISGIGTALGSVVWVYTSNLGNIVKRTVSDTAAIMAQNVQAEFKHLSEWTGVLGRASFASFKYPEDQLQFIQQNLAADDHYVSLSFHSMEKSADKAVVWRAINSKLSFAKDITPEVFNDFEKNFSFNQALLINGEPQFLTGILTLRSGTVVPLIRIALPFVKKDNQKFSSFLVFDLKQDKLTSIFNETTNAVSFLATVTGKVLATSDPKIYSIGKDVSLLSAFKACRPTATSNVNSGKQLDFIDLQNEKQIGACQRVGFAGLTVFTQMPDKIRSNHLLEMARRAAFLTAAFLILALFLGALFSRSITRPIHRLEQAAESVRRGDLSVQLDTPKNAQNGDEIQAFSVTFNEMVRGLRERDHIKNTFTKFHSKEIAEKILSGEVRLGGERLETTVLFCDIRGFTSFSEKLEPEVLISFLNRYLSAMVEIITHHGGVVDKYVGDAIMAVWGVPIAQPNDTLNAVFAALEMREGLALLNQQFAKEGLPVLKAGIGINRGSAVAGNVGSEERMEYTVIGDTVNTAARIESLTKTLETDLLVSQSVLNHVTKEFIFEKAHDSIAVKGKAEKIAVYKVLGYYNEAGKKVLVPSESPLAEPPLAESLLVPHATGAPESFPVRALPSAVPVPPPPPSGTKSITDLNRMVAPPPPPVTRMVNDLQATRILKSLQTSREPALHSSGYTPDLAPEKSAAVINLKDYLPGSSDKPDSGEAA